MNKKRLEIWNFISPSQATRWWLGWTLATSSKVPGALLSISPRFGFLNTQLSFLGCFYFCFSSSLIPAFPLHSRLLGSHAPQRSQMFSLRLPAFTNDSAAMRTTLLQSGLSSSLTEAAATGKCWGSDRFSLTTFHEFILSSHREPESYLMYMN